MSTLIGRGANPFGGATTKLPSRGHASLIDVSIAYAVAAAVATSPAVQREASRCLDGKALHLDQHITVGSDEPGARRRKAYRNCSEVTHFVT